MAARYSVAEVSTVGGRDKSCTVMTPAAEEVEWHSEVGEGHHENTGGMAMTAPPSCAMDELSLACRVVRFVILQRLVK